MQTQTTPSKLADCENTEFKRAVSELNLLASKEADAPGRVILVWIGPGWPQLSRHEIKPDTPAMKQNLFDYRVELLTDLRKAQITLNAISFPDSERDPEPRGAADKAIANGVTRADDASAASMALRVLVHETGGQTLDRGKDISSSIAACLADAASYYVLSFNSAGASKEGEYHALDVRVNRPGLTARTNKAYYTMP
jgi:VWFA-related protein